MSPGRWAQGGDPQRVPLCPSIALHPPRAAWQGGGEGIRAVACVELTASMWVAEGPSWGHSFTGQGTHRLLPSPVAPLLCVPTALLPRPLFLCAATAPLLPSTPRSPATGRALTVVCCVSPRRYCVPHTTMCVPTSLSCVPTPLCVSPRHCRVSPLLCRASIPCSGLAQPLQPR